jgi:hypothetical protein
VQRNDAALHAHMAGRVLEPQAYRAKLNALADDVQEDSCDVLELADGRLLERRSVPQRSHGMVVGRVYSFRDITRDVQSQAALRLAGRVFDSRSSTIRWGIPLVTGFFSWWRSDCKPACARPTCSVGWVEMSS